MRAVFEEAMDTPSEEAQWITKDTTWDTLFDAGSSKQRRLDFEMFQDQYSCFRLPHFAAIVRDSPAAEIMARLFGSQTITFFYDHLINKRAGTTKAIPWHQDLAHWKLGGNQIGSVWIPLDRMSEASSVRYIAGSHRWHLHRPRHFVDFSPYSGTEHMPPMPDIDELVLKGTAQALTFAVEPGDVVAFNARTIHGSPGNSCVDGDQRRIALRFGGDDCTYRDHQYETAMPTKEVDAMHGLADGDLLACATFPKVWPRDQVPQRFDMLHDQFRGARAQTGKGI
jgi:ectoine hydroxylase-related dioxygenase (phytanoyl-CoA dioxygenase family)